MKTLHVERLTRAAFAPFGDVIELDGARHFPDQRRHDRALSRCAKAFFVEVIKSQGLAPKTLTLDGHAASHRAVREINTDELFPEDTTLRSSKYLNKIIEQDRRNIKSRVNTTLGFKRLRNAAATISDIELMHRIGKGPFNLTQLRLKDTTAPAVWMAVLSARWCNGEHAVFRSRWQFAPA